tara:strand:+ start:2624 stop:3436 length:813 start_codon:yes stop_codon:yes gene_type:complete
MSKEIALKAFGQELATQKKALQSVLPAHIKPEKFMRTVMGAVQNNPAILSADRQSVFNACQKAAQDGLVIDGREAALVCFGKQAQYMPMVAGVLKKLRNSGELSTIIAQPVYSDDPFAYNPAVDTVPDHKPDWFGERGEFIGVYAVAKLKDGGTVVEIMSMKQIKKVKAVSRGGDRGPWKDWFEEMAIKSVIRRISKMLPSSADIDQMWSSDNENYDLNEPDSSAPTGPASTDDINNDLRSAPQQQPETVIESTGEVIEGQATAVDGDPI